MGARAFRVAILFGLASMCVCSAARSGQPERCGPGSFQKELDRLDGQISKELAEKNPVIQVMAADDGLYRTAGALASPPAVPSLSAAVSGRQYRVLIKGADGSSTSTIAVSTPQGFWITRTRTGSKMYRGEDIIEARPIYRADHTRYAASFDLYADEAVRPKELAVGHLYSFTTPDRSKYFYGHLKGYDASGNFILAAENGESLVLDVTLIDRNAIKSGHSIPELHDIPIEGLVGLDLKGTKKSDRLYKLLGFSDDGKVRVQAWSAKSWNYEGEALELSVSEIKAVGKVNDSGKLRLKPSELGLYSAGPAAGAGFTKAMMVTATWPAYIPMFLIDYMREQYLAKKGFEIYGWRKIKEAKQLEEPKKALLLPAGKL